MSEILVPIFICAVLPISIVLIVFLASINSDNKRAQVLIKAIEANNGFNADKLAEALSKPKKTPREVLNGRLLRGCIFLSVGLVLVIIALCSFFSGCEFWSDPVEVPMLGGGVLSAIGLSYLTVYFVTRKDVDRESVKERR